MKFRLDTNTCIIYMRGKNSTLKQKLESTATKDIAVCSIVKAELFYGPMKSANPQRNLTLQRQFLAQFTSLPFDDLAATIFGTIRSQLEAITNANPEITIAYPEITIAYLKITNAYPKITNAYPEITNGYPEITNGYPEITNGYPEITNAYPEITNA